LSDFPLECLNQVFTTVIYDTLITNQVPFILKFLKFSGETTDSPVNLFPLIEIIAK